MAFTHNFGDSITAGAGASTITKSYAALLDASLGTPSVDHGINGSAAADQVIVARGVVTTPSDIVTIMIGVNDAQRYLDATTQGYYKAFVRELVSWQNMPQRVAGRSASMALTGTWADSLPVPAWSAGKHSNVAGSTASATVSGTSVYIGTILQDMNPGSLNGSADVIVDGVTVGTISSNGAGMPTALGTYYAPAAFRFGGLAPGQHTVTVKVTSGWVYLEYLAGSDQPPGPPVYLSNVTRTFQVNDPATPAINAAFNAIIAGLVSDFQTDGRNVMLVDNNSIITQSDLISDMIHPNDGGHQKIANQFLSEISGFIAVPTYRKSDGTYWIDDGSNRRQLTVQ